MDMNILEGICPECGRHYVGRALHTRHNQLCVKCGSGLEIREDGFLVRNGFAPFNDEEYEVCPDGDNCEDMWDKSDLFYLARN
jgi:hypothetical protein